jgi:hypothetical protein
MRRLFAAIVVAFLFGSTPLSAANRDDGALDSIDINSQLIDRMRGSELSESVVAHLRALRASADVSELVQRKANSLLTLAESRKPGAVQPAPIVLPRPTQVQPELSAASEECATALPLSLGEGQRHQLPPFGHVWVRLHIDSPLTPRGIFISSRGSDVDVKLTVYEDCRTQKASPYTESDDVYGLQADVALPGDQRGFWMVKVESLSPRPGNAVVSGVYSATIRGNVTRQSNGENVRFVGVAALRLVDDAYRFQTIATTDVDGNYLLALTEPGTYVLRTSVGSQTHHFVADKAWPDIPCFESSPDTISNCYAEGQSPTTFTIVDFSADFTADFVLNDAPTITGQVTHTSNGQPVSGANITVVSASGNMRTATSDVSGRYVVEGFGYGPVQMYATAAGYHGNLYNDRECASVGCNIALGDILDTAVDQSYRVDFTLNRAPSISYVASAEGVPVPPGDYVNGKLLRADGSVAYEIGHAGPRGTFQAVEPGTYYLAVFTPRYFSTLYEGVDCQDDCVAELPQGQPLIISVDSSATEIMVEMRRYPSLRGIVSDSQTGQRIPYASVEIFDANTRHSRASISNAAGEFSVDDVQPGEYLLQFFSRGYVMRTWEASTCTPRDPGDSCADATRITFTSHSPDIFLQASLDPNASVSGTITSDASYFPLTTISLDFVDSDGNVVFQSVGNLNSQGRFDVSDLPAGTYRVGVRGQRHHPQLYPSVICPNATQSSWASCDLTQALPLRLENGSTVENVNLALTSYQSRPVRVVRKKDGRPAVGVTLDLWDSQRRHSDAAQTDADGLAWPAPYNSFLVTAGLYSLSTYNELGFIEQIYDGVDCPAGSVFFGYCDLGDSTPIHYPPTDFSELLIRIGDSDDLFGDGLER